MENYNFISPDATIINSKMGNNLKIYKNVEIKNSQLGDYISVGDQTIILESNLNSNVVLNRRNFIQQSSIGSYSYTGVNTIIRAVNIGNFCSISWNVSLGGKNHDYRMVTTSALWGFHNMDGGNKNSKFNYGEGQEPCIIGNDVWISTNVVVLRGVNIGNGAVIGAGAVVTKDIEPYSIAVGVPAKTIKKRFDDKTISALEEIQWWNWPKEVIRANLDLIYSSVVDEYVIDKLREVPKNIK